MFRLTSPLRRSPELRRRLALALATAENLIIQANVDEAVLFLQTTERHLCFEDALAIYYRLAGVPTKMRNAVTILTLSRLSEDRTVDDMLEDAPAEARGVMALARRLRGRRREMLRQEIENASARARAHVRKSYLDGATSTVETLRDVVPPAEAVQHFVDALQIGEGWAELVTNEVVGREWAEPGAAEHEQQARLETTDPDA